MRVRCYVIIGGALATVIAGTYGIANLIFNGSIL